MKRCSFSLTSKMKMTTLQGHNNILQLLLDAKAAPRDDWNRMRDACIEGRTDEVKALLDAGYRVDTPNMSGRHPLLLATKHGHIDIAEMLIAARADINVIDENNKTPLIHSIQRGNVLFARSLIQAKADASCHDLPVEEMPLMCAAREGDVSVIQMLIDAKAYTDGGYPTPRRREGSSSPA